MAGNKKDYEVGYGKPPVDTRFRKGQSGNPSGKRKVPLTHEQIVARELDRKITITEDGKKKRVTKREVIHMATIRKAMKGDLRAAVMVMELDKANYLSDQSEERTVFTLVFEEEELRRQQMLEEQTRDWRDEGSDDF